MDVGAKASSLHDVSWRIDSHNYLVHIRSYQKYLSLREYTLNQVGGTNSGELSFCATD